MKILADTSSVRGKLTHRTFLKLRKKYEGFKLVYETF